MPILRREEAPDLLGPYLVYLWQRKLWILVPGLLVFVLVYIAMRFVAEEYKATGALYVNRLMAGQDRDEVLSPATVAQLLESSMILHRVRDEYMQAFGIAHAPQFEKFARRFKVKTDILQDTSVRKDVSPVLELEVQSDGTSQTRFLMESWIRNAISEFGNVAADEAVSKRDNLQRENARLETEIQHAEGERSQVRTQLVLQEKLLAQSMDLLAPAEFSQKAVQSDRILNTDVDSRTGGDSRVEVSINSQPKPPGLLSHISSLQLQLALSRTGAAGTTPTTELERQAAAVNSVIQDMQTSISALQKTVADLTREVSRLDRDLEYKRSIQARLHISLNRYAVSAALATHAVENGLPAGADLRAISMPVQPELRIWPKRTFAAGGAALAAMLFISVALLLHRYLQAVVLKTREVVE